MVSFKNLSLSISSKEVDLLNELWEVQFKCKGKDRKMLPKHCLTILLATAALQRKKNSKQHLCRKICLPPKHTNKESSVLSSSLMEALWQACNVSEWILIVYHTVREAQSSSLQKQDSWCTFTLVHNHKTQNILSAHNPIECASIFSQSSLAKRA